MRRFLFSTVLLLTLISSAFAAEFAIHGVTDKDIAIYKVGEKIEFTFKVLEDGKAVAGKKITWVRSGDDGKNDKGEAISSLEGIKVVTTMDKPGFVRIKAKAFGEDEKPLQGFKGGWGASKQGNIFFDGGACVEPEKLKTVDEPADFDEFWESMRKTLSDVPLKPELKELEAKNPKMKLFAVSIPCAGPKPVTGYLSYPADAKPKSLPAKVTFHGYGVKKHNPPGRTNPKYIVFNVNAHGLELGASDEAFKKREAELKGYAFNKNENSKRTTSYFYGMSLRVMRALEFAKSLPQWNGKVLESNGGSQGGLQALWGAGLDPDVTSSDCWSPWSCDLGGITLGRLKGWRPAYNTELDYYDPVFHVKRTTAKIHLIVNYGDYTCPPSSVWLVYNNIPHDNKSMAVKQGCTHSYAMKNHRSYKFSPEMNKQR